MDDHFEVHYKAFSALFADNNKVTWAKVVSEWKSLLGALGLPGTMQSEIRPCFDYLSRLHPKNYSLESFKVEQFAYCVGLLFTLLDEEEEKEARLSIIHFLND